MIALIIVLCAAIVFIIALIIKNQRDIKAAALAKANAAKPAPKKEDPPAPPIGYDPNRTVGLFDESPLVPTLFLQDIDNVSDITYSAPLTSVMSVGRSVDNDIVIPDSTVSGKHCEFYLVDEELYVRDMWSTNGTRILRGEKSIDIKGSNGQKLLEGDKLQLGKIKLVPTIK